MVCKDPGRVEEYANHGARLRESNPTHPRSVVAMPGATAMSSSVAKNYFQKERDIRLESKSLSMRDPHCEIAPLSSLR